jgi:GT2 family glycosyltransferase
MVEQTFFSIKPIEFLRQKNEAAEKPIFSILIVSWNNLEYLKLCVKSILQNSTYSHQILIHVNQGSDGTLEWVKENGFDFTHSTENIGVCYGMNALSPLMKADYVLLIDDDNYVAPNWDKILIKEIEKVGHKYFAISSTRIEPYPYIDSSSIAGVDFGQTPQTFREEDFLANYMNYEIADWNGSNWYPMVIHRDIWGLIGGLSTEFTPGMGSDPDFLMKLWLSGVRYFKGVSNSRAYHFCSRTTARVKKNNGKKQFVKKWGMNISTFYKYYVHMGEPFIGYIDDSNAFKNAKFKIFIDRLKALF